MRYKICRWPFGGDAESHSPGQPLLEFGLIAAHCADGRQRGRLLRRMAKFASLPRIAIDRLAGTHDHHIPRFA